MLYFIFNFISSTVIDMDFARMFHDELGIWSSVDINGNRRRVRFPNPSSLQVGRSYVLFMRWLVTIVFYFVMLETVPSKFLFSRNHHQENLFLPFHSYYPQQADRQEQQKTMTQASVRKRNSNKQKLIFSNTLTHYKANGSQLVSVFCYLFLNVMNTIKKWF